MSAVKLYYIRNVREVGNCVRWWRPDGAGYTVDLSKAWKVPRDRAESICHDRPREDFAYEVGAVDAITEQHVDMQLLRDVKHLPHPRSL